MEDDIAEIEHFQTKLRRLESAFGIRRVRIEEERLAKTAAIKQAEAARDEHENATEKELQEERKKIDKLRRVLLTLKDDKIDDQQHGARMVQELNENQPIVVNLFYEHQR